MRRCELCNETGIVTIWAPNVIEDVLKGNDVAAPITAAIPCKCSKADKYATVTMRTGETRDVARLGDRWWHCRVVNPFDPAKDVREHKIERPKQEKPFEEWNERQ